MRIACHANSPFGTLTALYEDGVIRRVLFPDESVGAGYMTDDSLPFAVQIAEYFSGMRLSFDLPVLLPGTPFRQAVYAATIRIPYGRTATYGDVALAAGLPPCHARGRHHDEAQPAAVPCSLPSRRSQIFFTGILPRRSGYQGDSA